jgi:UDP-glucuronate decarboxylase
MEHPELAGEVMNIGSTHEITTRELAETVLDVVDTKSKVTRKPLPKGDPQRRQPDISRADRLLN